MTEIQRRRMTIVLRQGSGWAGSLSGMVAWDNTQRSLAQECLQRT